MNDHPSTELNVAEWRLRHPPLPDRYEYVERVLAGYRRTRTTTGTVRAADRRLAFELYEQGVTLDLIEAAFALTAVRRIFRPPDSTPLQPIRSLHYFLPVINEIYRDNIPFGYIECQKWKLDHLEEYSHLIGTPPQ